MRLRIVIAAFASLLAAAVLVGIGSATANDKVLLQYDPDLDSTGPTGYGFVNYNKNDAGDLRVEVSLKNAAPNETWTVYLVCGPTHDTGCGFIDIGEVSTNGAGNGNSGAIWVEDPPYVGGPDEHIDLVGPEPYIATPIDNN